MPMSGTRNILVLGYDKVENNLIYGILKRHLNDFDAFITDSIGSKGCRGNS